MFLLMTECRLAGFTRFLLFFPEQNLCRSVAYVLFTGWMSFLWSCHLPCCNTDDIDDEPDFWNACQLKCCNIKKVKFSHTRYRALGPELIPVYRQSARRWREVNHAIYPAVVCHCFLPGLRLPSWLSPDGATCKRQHTSNSSLLLILSTPKGWKAELA